MIKKIIFGVVLNGLALYLVAKFFPDLQYTGGIAFFALGGLIIGILNTFVKPLMKLLALPFLLFTMGLFIFVINAIIFWLTMKAVNVISIADVAVTISDPLTYIWGALVFGLVNWILHLIINNK